MVANIDFSLSGPAWSLVHLSSTKPRAKSSKGATEDVKSWCCITSGAEQSITDSGTGVWGKAASSSEQPFVRKAVRQGKKWCFTLDPRLVQRLSEFQWAKARARGWPCCSTAWASARWALSCPMASGPQQKLELLWFHSRESQKRAWQDVCSPKSQTSCGRKKNVKMFAA